MIVWRREVGGKNAKGQEETFSDGYVHYLVCGEAVDGFLGLYLLNCALQIHAVYCMLVIHSSIKLFLKRGGKE